MNIHEYQAKEILGKYGVAVPAGQVCKTAEEAKAVSEKLLKGGTGMVVVKSQIHAGGRGKGTFKSGFQGGVKLCKTADDAYEKAKAMLGQTLVTKQTGPPRSRRCNAGGTARPANPSRTRASATAAAGISRSDVGPPPVWSVIALLRDRPSSSRGQKVASTHSQCSTSDSGRARAVSFSRTTHLAKAPFRPPSAVPPCRRSRRSPLRRPFRCAAAKRR